jgi:capsular exopolysaccharide synthesis family protein
LSEPPSEGGRDLRSYGKVFWRWKWLFLICVLAIPTGAYFLSARNKKLYQSSVVLQISQLSVDSPLFGNQTAPTNPAQVVNTAARLIATSAVAAEAARRLHPPPPRSRSLLGQIGVIPDPEASFVTITARASIPQRAADIANAFAEALKVQRANQATKRLDRGIARLKLQLEQLKGDRVQERQLSQQLQQFRALRAVQDANAEVVEAAVPSRSAVSPRPVRTAALGLILAILIGLGAVVLAENVDRRVRRADELEALTGLPLLSSIPRTAYPGEEHSHQDEEAFQRLRANLTYFNIDRSLASVLVTSPVAADGKTTVATNLAKTLARSGKDVILVDADLRRPQVAERLGIKATSGLSSVLTSDENVQEALVDYPIESIYRGRLQVLPAGTPPPNPSELLASQRMRTLLSHLGIVSDIVIIDTSPLLTISDTTPLLEQVSGIVMVAQVGAANKDAVRRFVQVVTAAHGTLLGVVATGTTDSDQTGYYGYYEQHPDEGKPPREGGRRAERAQRRARAERAVATPAPEGGQVRRAVTLPRSRQTTPAPPKPRQATPATPKPRTPLAERFGLGRRLSSLLALGVVLVAGGVVAIAVLAPFGQGSDLATTKKPPARPAATTTKAESSQPAVTRTTKGQTKTAGGVSPQDYRVERVRWSQYSDAHKLAAATLFVKNNPRSCVGRAPASIVNFLHERWQRDYPRAIATDVMLAYCDRSTSGTSTG